MAIVLDGTNGIDTPDLASAGPITGTTGTFSGAVSGTTGSFPSGVSVGPSITFGDATVQTTAAVPASTAFDGVGSYVIAYYGANSTATTANRVSTLATGTTVAGSSLRVSSLATSNNIASTGQAGASSSGAIYAAGPSGITFLTTNSTTLSGTWRAMVGGTWTSSVNTCCGLVYYWWPLLWVRIS